MFSISTKTCLALGVALCLSSFTTAQDFPHGDFPHGDSPPQTGQDSPSGDSPPQTGEDVPQVVPEPDDNRIDDNMIVAFGDPHFRTWSGETYDFHGVCDLVLLKNEQFDGVGMDIHIRSKKMHERFSYVNSASVRIGDDTLEVKGGKEGGYWINGEQGADIDNDEELAVLSGKFTVAIKKVNDKSREVTINLGGNEATVITTWNAMVRVSIRNASSEHFGTSIGMMGAFLTGEKLGRDGVTNVNDFDKFGQEWQVLPTESKLFHEISDAVQSPARCDIPSRSEMRRHLGEAFITVEEAKMACSRVDPAEFEMCIFDVMVSSDKDLAGAY